MSAKKRKTLIPCMCTGLLATAMLGSCLDPSAIAPGRSARSRVSFDLRTLQQKMSASSPAQAQSLLDSLVLVVTPEDGDRQEMGQKISPNQDEVSFEIEVETGTARFAAELLSNSSVALYAGEQKVAIRDDGFNVSIPMSAVDAIMAISTDSVAVFAGSERFVRIRNAGVKTLEWQVGEVVPLNNACSRSCILYSPQSGTVAPGAFVDLNIVRGQGAVGDRYLMPLLSNVGRLDVLVEIVPEPKPDLIISTFEKTGDPVVNAKNSVELPVRMVVQNQGDRPAGIFKVSTEYTGPGGTFAVAFTVPGQSSIFYPFTKAALAAGDSAIFIGRVVFHPSVHKVTVSLRGFADSCSGDEFSQRYCRVDESNELNNVSRDIKVDLP